MCDPTGSGNVGRDGLYKSLALAALAQQGKGIDEKALHHYGESGERHVMKPVQTRGGVCNNIVVELEALRLLWCLSPYGGYFLLGLLASPKRLIFVVITFLTISLGRASFSVAGPHCGNA